MDINLDRKIRALLALAGDTTTTEAEAALAAAKAAELVKKYNIDLSKLTKIGTTSPFVVVHADLCEPFAGSEPAHFLYLRGTIAELFDVFVYSSKYTECSVCGIKGTNVTKKVYRGIGLADDVEAARRTLTYLKNVIETLLKKRKAERSISGASQANSYRKGAGSAIFAGAKKLKQEMLGNMEGCQALVLMVKPMVDKEVKKMDFGKGKYVRMKYSSGVAFSKGYTDGSLVDLSANKKIKAAGGN